MEILLAIVGFITITILDKVWFKLDYKRIEKGFEIVEHYHWGIVLIGAGIILLSYSPYLAYFAAGAGIGLIYHESRQKNYFAHKSNHFGSSSVIGIILCLVVFFAYVLQYFIIIYNVSCF